MRIPHFSCLVAWYTRKCRCKPTQQLLNHMEQLFLYINSLHKCLLFMPHLPLRQHIYFVSKSQHSSLHLLAFVHTAKMKEAEELKSACPKSQTQGTKEGWQPERKGERLCLRRWCWRATPCLHRTPAARWRSTGSRCSSSGCRCELCWSCTTEWEKRRR